MLRATENDTDLLAEVRMFWTEPALHIPLLSEDDVSCIAVAVLGWLQVRPIFSSPTIPFKLVLNGRLLCF